jgi:hypothetical protein
MDEEELEEKGRKVVETSSGYDTFGHAASEQARTAALKDQPRRPGLPAVDLTDIIAPVPDSVGMSPLFTALHLSSCPMWFSEASSYRFQLVSRCVFSLQQHLSPSVCSGPCRTNVRLQRYIVRV